MSFKDLTKRAADDLTSKPAATPAKKPDETKQAQTNQPAPKSNAS